jgi:mono/diheme cytochrome c family protein
MTKWLIPALAVLLPLASRAGDARSVSEGHAIALKVCAVCHVVAADQTAPPHMRPPAPSFAEISARPEMTEMFLRNFLMKPHGEARALSAMPAFLIPGEADAMIAFLLSLKPRS